MNVLKLKTNDFYDSREWKELRYRVLVKKGNYCQACGRSPKDGISIHVDHIKPKSRFPHLSLREDNLQILCEDCNIGKSNKSCENWDLINKKTISKSNDPAKEKSNKKCNHDIFYQEYFAKTFKNGTIHVRKICSGCGFGCYVNREAGLKIIKHRESTK